MENIEKDYNSSESLDNLLRVTYVAYINYINLAYISPIGSVYYQKQIIAATENLRLHIRVKSKKIILDHC